MTLEMDYLATRRKQHVATGMFKVSRDLVPPKVRQYFKPVSEAQAQNTR